MVKQVIKRNGSQVDFCKSKIITAIQKATRDVESLEGLRDEQVENIALFIACTEAPVLTVEEIQDVVEDQLLLLGKWKLAKEYIKYRYRRALVRKSNTTDESILSLICGTNQQLKEENSNKDATMASTQRDYIAGEVSRDLTNRLLLPESVVEAHKNGVLHFHDADYFVQNIFNCCLINMQDMLDNGTVMNGKLIESPKSFRVACTILTQIIAAVASNQYGGQSVDLACLTPYVQKSRLKHRKEIDEALTRSGIKELLLKETPEAYDSYLEGLAELRLSKEVADGVQTIQYQINTLMTTNGQAPFVTLFMQVKEDNPGCEDTVKVIAEVLRQRLAGIKNEKGVYVTPAFPKLVYVLDECNCLQGGKYDWLTELAVKCSASRMYPDYISAKKMRENYEGNVFSPMGCRSFLSPWKDENGNYKFDGRFNQGVVSLNLPQIGILAGGDENLFWKLLEERLALCFEALMCRHNALLGTLSDVSPIHWQYGAIARLEKGEKIDKLLKGGYSTLSLGYIGVYEVTKLMTGESHTTSKGSEFALRLMHRLREATDSWKRETGLGFALYGTPAESLCYRFAEIDKAKFGVIQDVTDKGFYTNSYHVDVREEMDALQKFTFESQFHTISSGGAISYVEIPNVKNNLKALQTLVQFIYENIQYAEFNTKSDYCMECGFDGEIKINENLEWECPQCGNKDHRKMSVTRRTCGYLGENFWNVGKTKEINQRVLHL